METPRTPPRDKSPNDLAKQLEVTKQRVAEANDHIAALGEGAKLVGLSIDGATWEVNGCLKQLFLCSQHDMPEYEIIYSVLMNHLRTIKQIADSKFGKVKIEGTH